MWRNDIRVHKCCAPYMYKILMSHMNFLCRSFKLIPLHPHLEPRPMNTTDNSADNVFIFTPMNLNASSDKVKTDVGKGMLYIKN